MKINIPFYGTIRISLNVKFTSRKEELKRLVECLEKDRSMNPDWAAMTSLIPPQQRFVDGNGRIAWMIAHELQEEGKQ